MDNRKMRLYTQFPQIIPTFAEDAIKQLEVETGMRIENEKDLAVAYRKFDASRVARGGEPSKFVIQDPPKGRGH